MILINKEILIQGNFLNYEEVENQNILHITKNVSHQQGNFDSRQIAPTASGKFTPTANFLTTNNSLTNFYFSIFSGLDFWLQFVTSLPCLLFLLPKLTLVCTCIYWRGFISDWFKE